MKSKCSLNLLEVFSELPDPRSDRTKKHILGEVHLIAFGAICSGFRGWDEMNDFGLLHRDWLGKFLSLLNGIPSADTFRRVFAALDHRCFEEAFLSWTQDLCKDTEQQVLAVDGKTLRNRRHPISLVSAWCRSNGGLCFAQRAVEDGTNEIAAVPELLKILSLRGALVSMDAAHCQKETLSTIRTGGGDYVVCVKTNQKKLQKAVREQFEEYAVELRIPEVRSESTDKQGGRVETRSIRVLGDVEWIQAELGWDGIKSVAEVTRLRTQGENESRTVHYYISSLKPDAERLHEAIRGHWEVENKMHWQLDVTYGEDDSRVRNVQAEKNLAVLRRLSLNKLREIRTSLPAALQNKSLKHVQRRVFIDPDIRLKALLG